MKENLDPSVAHLPKKCSECSKNIEHTHRMYRSMGFCMKHWRENADALYEEWSMTREACR